VFDEAFRYQRHLAPLSRLGHAQKGALLPVVSARHEESGDQLRFLTRCSLPTPPTILSAGLDLQNGALLPLSPPGGERVAEGRVRGRATSVKVPLH
jgi:hypothetical protein